MTNFLVFIIILHLVAGFGFVLWKVAGPVKDKDKKREDE
jgi:type IV secretory pathway TrbD component